VAFVSGLLGEHRRQIGTRRGSRALSCRKQAVFVLAWFRDRPDVRRLGKGFGISQATAYRYLHEGIDVLAARAPGLKEALEKAIELGLAYLILDGKVVAADRCTGAERQPVLMPTRTHTNAKQHHPRPPRSARQVDGCPAASARAPAAIPQGRWHDVSKRCKSTC
jgi:hypothetical protein